MYKKVYVVMLVAVLTASYAQAQITIGARAGFSLTSMSEKYDGKKLDNEDIITMVKPGFQIGITGDYALTDAFSVQSGLLIAMQGCRKDITFEGYYLMLPSYDEKLTMSITYLQIPVNAQYQMSLGKKKLLFQAGPYLGFAFGGKMKSKVNSQYYGERTEEEKIEFGSDEDKMKRLDAGLALGTGLQFGRLRAGVGYSFGLMNLSNVDKVSLKNNAFTLSLTYMFGL